jgi:hypothetical protein
MEPKTTIANHSSPRRLPPHSNNSNQGLDQGDGEMAEDTEEDDLDIDDDDAQRSSSAFGFILGGGDGGGDGEEDEEHGEGEAATSSSAFEFLSSSDTNDDKDGSSETIPENSGKKPMSMPNPTKPNQQAAQPSPVCVGKATAPVVVARVPSPSPSILSSPGTKTKKRTLGVRPGYAADAAAPPSPSPITPTSTGNDKATQQKIVAPTTTSPSTPVKATPTTKGKGKSTPNVAINADSTQDDSIERSPMQHAPEDAKPPIPAPVEEKENVNETDDSRTKDDGDGVNSKSVEVIRRKEEEPEEEVVVVEVSGEMSQEEMLAALRTDALATKREYQSTYEHLAQKQRRLESLEQEQILATEAENFEHAEEIALQMQSCRHEMLDLEHRVVSLVAELADLHATHHSQQQKHILVLDQQHDSLAKLQSQYTAELKQLKTSLSSQERQVHDSLVVRREDLQEESLRVKEAQDKHAEKQKRYQDDLLNLTRPLVEEKQRCQSHVDQLQNEIEQLMEKIREKQEEQADFNTRIASCEEQIASAATVFEHDRQRLQVSAQRIQEHANRVELERKELKQEEAVLAEKLKDQHEAVRSHETTLKNTARQLVDVDESCKEAERMAATSLRDSEEYRKYWQLLRQYHDDTMASHQRLKEMQVELDNACGRQVQTHQSLQLLRERVVTLRNDTLPSLERAKKQAVTAKNFKDAGKLQSDMKQVTTDIEETEAQITRLETDADTNANSVSELTSLLKAQQDSQRELERVRDLERATYLVARRSTLARALQRALKAASSNNSSSSNNNGNNLEQLSADIAALTAELEYVALKCRLSVSDLVSQSTTATGYPGSDSDIENGDRQEDTEQQEEHNNNNTEDDDEHVPGVDEAREIGIGTGASSEDVTMIKAASGDTEEVEGQGQEAGLASSHHDDDTSSSLFSDIAHSDDNGDDDEGDNVAPSQIHPTDHEDEDEDPVAPTPTTAKDNNNVNTGDGDGDGDGDDVDVDSRGGSSMFDFLEDAPAAVVTTDVDPDDQGQGLSDSTELAERARREEQEELERKRQQQQEAEQAEAAAREQEREREREREREEMMEQKAALESQLEEAVHAENYELADQLNSAVEDLTQRLAALQ